MAAALRRVEAWSDEITADGVLEAMGDPVVVIGPATELLFANRAAHARYGPELQDHLGRPLHELIHPDDLDTALLSLISVVTKETGTLVEIRVRDAAGAWSWFEVRGRAWTDGPAGAIVLTLRESTERRRWEISQGDARLMGALLDHLPVMGLLLAPDGTLRGANRALTRSLHVAVEDVLGQPFTDLVAERDVARVTRALAACGRGRRGQGCHHLEAHLVAADGRLVPMSLTVVDLLDDRAVEGVMVTASDISPLVAARRELHRLAAIDDLTGLPNRSSLRHHLRAVMARPESDHSILFADVDGLKVVNDEHGHRAGDAVLVAVARRLLAATRTGDFVARLAGDEFVVVVPTTDPDALRVLQARIDHAMAEPIALPAAPDSVLSVSVGVAPLGEAADLETLLHHADVAMYLAKRDRQR